MRCWDAVLHGPRASPGEDQDIDGRTDVVSRWELSCGSCSPDGWRSPPRRSRRRSTRCARSTRRDVHMVCAPTSRRRCRWSSGVRWPRTRRPDAGRRDAGSRVRRRAPTAWRRAACRRRLPAAMRTLAEVMGRCHRTPSRPPPPGRPRIVPPPRWRPAVARGRRSGRRITTPSRRPSRPPCLLRHTGQRGLIACPGTRGQRGTARVDAELAAPGPARASRSGTRIPDRDRLGDVPVPRSRRREVLALAIACIASAMMVIGAVLRCPRALVERRQRRRDDRRGAAPPAPAPAAQPSEVEIVFNVEPAGAEVVLRIDGVVITDQRLRHTPLRDTARGHCRGRGVPDVPGRDRSDRDQSSR